MDQQVEFSKELTAGNVKAAMKNIGASSSDLWKVKREHIRVLPDFNVRIKDANHAAHIESLSQSMAENGFMADKPLAGYVATEDGVNIIYVTDGHCRLEAYDAAIANGVALADTLPVVVKPKGTSMEDLTVALVTSNSGKPLSALEIGVVCQRLVKFGWEEKRIADKIGVTRTYVSDLLKLIAAPASLRNLVSSGKVSATLAIQTIKDHGDQAVEKLDAAIELAEKDGKNKVTAKDVAQPKKKKAKKDKQNLAEEMFAILLDMADLIEDPKRMGASHAKLKECVLSFREDINDIIAKVSGGKATPVKGAQQ